MKKKVNKYVNIEAFLSDIELIRANCYAYNQNIPQNVGLVSSLLCFSIGIRLMCFSPCLMVVAYGNDMCLITQLPLADTFVKDVRGLVEYFQGDEDDDLEDADDYD